MLSINHYAGFFSCCSVKICKIVKHILMHKQLPEIDSSGLFDYYKVDNNKDITYDFFEHYNNIEQEIDFEKIINIDNSNFQFNDYKKVDYKTIIPYVKKYFTPSQKILSVEKQLMSSYCINPENCVAVYFRGTDKVTETKIDGFHRYYEKLQEILSKEPQLQILIQTDSYPFLNYMKTKNMNNVIVISENSTSNTSRGIHNEKTRAENNIDIQYFFATCLIMSKCKHIICTSGNGSIWTMYYRGNANNVHQNLNCVWL